jgi:outer membrane protein TolC
MISAVALGQAKDCPIQSTDDVVLCVISNHPNVLDLNSELAIAEAGVDRASQRPNPNLSSEVSAKTQGDILLGTSYMHILERGGKLDARVNLAKAEIEVSRSKIRNEQEAIALETLDHLYALRQLDETFELIHEILEIYDHGLRKYNAQQFLPPDVEVERDILKVAKQEMRSRESVANSQKMEHLTWLKRALGQPLPEDEKLWLPKSDLWKLSSEPELKESTQSVTNRVRIAEAQSRLGLEEAMANSDIGIGPIVEIEREDNEWNAGIGVGVSVDLPIYHRNEGAILVARRETEAAQLRWQRQKDFELSNLELLKEKYRNAIVRLNELESGNEAKKLHDIIDKKSKTGLFRPQTIIEAHRQLIESLERKQELELIALNSKWLISIISGDFLPKKGPSQ